MSFISPLTSGTAISPVDGEHRNITAPLGDHLSEFGLIKARVEIEVEYLIHFVENNIHPDTPDFSEETKEHLRSVYKNFAEADAQRIKEIEVRGVSKTETTKAIPATNHDVKAVEYFVREQLQALGLGEYEEFTHLGLTSQDINNTAVPLTIDRSTRNILLPALESFLDNIKAQEGMPAKIISDLEEEIAELRAYKPSGKFGGATGGFNALHKAYPEIDWPQFGDTLLDEKLGLERQQFTTQIEHYDSLMTHFATYKRIASILRKIAVCQEFSNTSDAAPTIQAVASANAYIEHFITKLPVSRHQRDLSDSTVTRNFGMPLGYIMIAIQEIEQKTLGGNTKSIQLSDTDDINPLTATGAIDGRYRQRSTQPLAEYFSSDATTTTPIKSSLEEIITPGLQEVLELIGGKAQEYKGVKMLGYTHGQTATPTDFGKEFQVFFERLDKHIPGIMHGSNAKKLDICITLNTTLLDLCRDIWLYIHKGFLKQKVIAGEIGSSAMPHKVNPIDFENAEGNLGMASALLQAMTRDDEVFSERTVGEAFSFMLIAIGSIKKGLGKIDVNKEVIQEDLDENPMVLAEMIQTYFKKQGITGAYEQLKEFTRGESKTLKDLHALIDGMEELDAIDKEQLKISPAEYIGQYPDF